MKKTLFFTSVFIISVLILSGCSHLLPPFGKKQPSKTSVFLPQDVSSSRDSTLSNVESDPGQTASTLSTHELIEEAYNLACMGARQYQSQKNDEALTNMDASMLNLQLADVPDFMQTIAFFQTYLPSDLKDINLTEAYDDLRHSTEISLTDLPEPLLLEKAEFAGTDQDFIKNEILRIAANLGEEYPSEEDLDIFIHEVERFLRYYQFQRKDWFERSYYRMLKYHQTIDKILTEKRLPSELAYLAFVESGYLYRATSRAGARGLWQFIRSTGRYYGLKVGQYTDERLDPIKSTIAARDYLLDLISIFGSRSFLLAMASYNAGEGKVQRCLKQLDNPFEDRSFWKIRPCLRKETREYIPRIIAANIICENPTRFDFDLPAYTEYSSRFDLVICSHRVKLSSVASAAGISISQLRQLNPDLPSGLSWTPSNNTHLWIPKGTVSIVKTALKKMPSPPDFKASGNYHTVRRGENLYTIGRRYKVPYKKLAQWNNIPPPFKIKPRQKIRLNPPGSTRSASKDSQKLECNETLVYVVKQGNFLAGIGSIFGVSARDIMSLNKLSRGTIFPGQRLYICTGFPIKIVNHKVKRNDTLIKIAKKYLTSVDAICFVNGIRKNSLLRIGKELTVYQRVSG